MLLYPSPWHTLVRHPLRPSSCHRCLARASSALSAGPAALRLLGIVLAPTIRSTSTTAFSAKIRRTSHRLAGLWVLPFLRACHTTQPPFVLYCFCCPSFPFFSTRLLLSLLPFFVRTFLPVLPPARRDASGSISRPMAFVLGAIGSSIRRPPADCPALCSARLAVLLIGGSRGLPVLCAAPAFLGGSSFPPLAVASILTWPTLPSLPLILSRALRRFLRQLFRWVWVFLFSLRSNASPLFVFVVFCLGLLRPSSPLSTSTRLLRLHACVRARWPTVVHGPTEGEGSSAYCGTRPRLRLQHASVRVRRPAVVHGPTECEGSSAYRGTRPRLRLQRAFVRVRRLTVVHGPTEGEGSSAYRSTRPRLRQQRAFARVRRPFVVHGPAEGEGMSAHRGSLPRSRLQHAFAKVRRPTVAHCLAGGEGMSALRGTLPRLHWDVDALGLLRSLFRACLRPRTPGPHTDARGPPASWASRRRGSPGGGGGSGGGA